METCKAKANKQKQIYLYMYIRKDMFYINAMAANAAACQQKKTITITTTASKQRRTTKTKVHNKTAWKMIMTAATVAATGQCEKWLYIYFMCMDLYTRCQLGLQQVNYPHKRAWITFFHRFYFFSLH